MVIMRVPEPAEHSGAAPSQPTVCSWKRQAELHKVPSCSSRHGRTQINREESSERPACSVAPPARAQRRAQFAHWQSTQGTTSHAGTGYSTIS